MAHEQETESNEVLKHKFQKLHATVVNQFDAIDTIDILFQEDVLSDREAHTLHLKDKRRYEQCRDLLSLLHDSHNSQAFVQLYLAIKNQGRHQWLIDRLDKYSDQKVQALKQQQEYINKPMGEVVHTLPEGSPVVGVTSTDDRIFVLRKRTDDEIEVYDAITYHLLRFLSVLNARDNVLVDITSSKCHRCLYIADGSDDCVHSLDIDPQGPVRQWAVYDKPLGISVNREQNVLVLLKNCNINEFNSLGHLVRQIALPDISSRPLHAVQLISGKFVVCHGDPVKADSSVCTVSPDGRETVHAGGQPGSNTGQNDGPRYFAVDDNEFMFVANVKSRRVTLLSPTLTHVRDVVSCDKLQWSPVRLCLHEDAHRRRYLCVADNDFHDGMYTEGRVVVFSV